MQYDGNVMNSSLGTRISGPEETLGNWHLIRINVEGMLLVI